MAGSRYRHVRPLSPMSRKMKRLVDHERLPDSGSTARLAKKLRHEGGEVACSMESGETLGSRSETGMQRGDVYDQFHGKTVIDRFLDFQTDQQTTLVSILLSCLLHTRYIRCAQREKLHQSLDISKIFPSLFFPILFFLIPLPPSTNSAEI